MSGTNVYVNFSTGNKEQLTNWTKLYFQILFWSPRKQSKFIMSPKTHSTATLPWLMDLLKCCSRGVGEAPLKGLCKCTHNRYAGSLKTHTWLGYSSRSWVSCQHISMGNETVLTWYNSIHKDNRDSLTYRHRTTAKILLVDDFNLMRKWSSFRCHRGFLSYDPYWFDY